ncbi:MAG: SDR family NAD(P)-dependent oxidoreductase [Saprospiraceae bacterium]|nr:SDR family NAD(P)-dependent oxidoreductase [Saprospiraceae bacterium]
MSFTNKTAIITGGAKGIGGACSRVFPFFVQHAIPFMLKQGSGVVINVSSVQAFISQQNVAPYTTPRLPCSA